MNKARPTTPRSIRAVPRTFEPAPAAAHLARVLLDNDWTLSGVEVRVIHNASLTDHSGLTITVSSEAGQARLDFYSEYRRIDDHLTRQPWHAQATRELPVEILASITSANTIASDDDPTDLHETLTAAGWSRPYPLEQKWISPGQDREVVFIDDEIEDTPLPWQIRHTAGRPVTFHASEDTPTAVILAVALTDLTLR